MKKIVNNIAFKVMFWVCWIIATIIVQIIVIGIGNGVNKILQFGNVDVLEAAINIIFYIFIALLDFFWLCIINKQEKSKGIFVFQMVIVMLHIYFVEYAFTGIVISFVKSIQNIYSFIMSINMILILFVLFWLSMKQYKKMFLIKMEEKNV